MRGKFKPDVPECTAGRITSGFRVKYVVSRAKHRTLQLQYRNLLPWNYGIYVDFWIGLKADVFNQVIYSKVHHWVCKAALLVQEPA